MGTDENKMKLFYILICYLFLTNCAYNVKTNITDIIQTKIIHDGKDIELRGYLFIHHENMIQIYSSKESLANNNHFDVILNNDTNIVDILHANRFICVDLIGKFHAHSQDVILTGYLTSREGLVEVNSISKCKR